MWRQTLLCLLRRVPRSTIALLCFLLSLGMLVSTFFIWDQTRSPRGDERSHDLQEYLRHTVNLNSEVFSTKTKSQHKLDFLLEDSSQIHRILSLNSDLSQNMSSSHIALGISGKYVSSIMKNTNSSLRKNIRKRGTTYQNDRPSQIYTRNSVPLSTFIKHSLDSRHLVDIKQSKSSVVIKEAEMVRPLRHTPTSRLTLVDIGYDMRQSLNASEFIMRTNQSPPSSDTNIPPFNTSHLSESTSSGDMYLMGKILARPLSLVVGGIYWSQEVERMMPTGIASLTADQWLAKAGQARLLSLEQASWDRCGQMKNGFIVLEHTGGACVRYRSPRDRFLQGDVMSYWLSRLLEMDSVPPVFLSSVDADRWSVQRKLFSDFGWENGSLVAVSMWVDEMDSRPETQVLMPPMLLEAYRRGRPVDRKTLNRLEIFTYNRSKMNDSLLRTDINTNGSNGWDTVTTLAQWGTLILFDFLTGNYDRVASMQDGAEIEQRPSILTESIRNLRKSRHRLKLWLIDNESAFLDAYDVMYGRPGKGQRFLGYHEQMLHTLCVFQRSVVDRLLLLHSHRKPHRALLKFVQEREPAFDHLARETTFQLFVKYFAKRLETVISWIRYCEDKER